MDSTFNEKRKRRLTLYYSLLVTIICIIGVSFAWFRLYLSQQEDNTLASRTCFSTTLTEENSKIELTDAFPITDAKGLKQTPFTFTVKNNCSGYVKMYITIDSTYRTSTSSSYLNDKYIKVNISPKGTTKNPSLILGEQTLTELEDSSKGYIIIESGLKANEEKSYDLRIWMDSAVTTEEGLNKTWSGKIVVITSAAILTLKDSILVDNEIVEPLTVPGKEVSAHTLDEVESQTTSVDSDYQKYYITYGTGWSANGLNFNLTGASVTSDTYANSYSSLVGKYLVSASQYSFGSQTAGKMNSITNLNNVYYVVSTTSSSFTYKVLGSNKNKTEALMASAEDDYGTSYYFRGAVRNNYVEFANKCWRIVRIVGDGSVKLVLHNDNTSGKSNPCSASNNGDTSAFLHINSGSTGVFSPFVNDNITVGFMYGEIGASDYASTHANINESSILMNLEYWYKNNLISYENKLADTIWCNDKSTSSGLGYGTNETSYAAHNRLFSTEQPTLKCPNDNNGGKLSKFTVSDTINGNGNLNYKIGLLTGDELAYAGYTYGSNNLANYLQENTEGWRQGWWTMTPDDTTSVIKVYEGNIYSATTMEMNGVRPAISLVSNTTISGGSGTSEDPYIVK